MRYIKAGPYEVLTEGCEGTKRWSPPGLVTTKWPVVGIMTAFSRVPGNPAAAPLPRDAEPRCHSLLPTVPSSWVMPGFAECPLASRGKYLDRKAAFAWSPKKD